MQPFLAESLMQKSNTDILKSKQKVQLTKVTKHSDETEVKIEKFINKSTNSQMNYSPVPLEAIKIGNPWNCCQTKVQIVIVTLKFQNRKSVVRVWL